jgi:hypothetical protein
VYFTLTNRNLEARFVCLIWCISGATAAADRICCVCNGLFSPVLDLRKERLPWRPQAGSRCPNTVAPALCNGRSRAGTRLSRAVFIFWWAEVLHRCTILAALESVFSVQTSTAWPPIDCVIVRPQSARFAAAAVSLVSPQRLPKVAPPEKLISHVYARA